jgi:ABC-type polysaccharide transport system permease subunit
VWDFILCELLNLNYIAPAWLYMAVFMVSLTLEILCVLSFIIAMVYFSRSNNILQYLVDKCYDTFISIPCFLSLVVVNMILILIAPQKEIWISVGLLAFMVVCCVAGMAFLFNFLRSDNDRSLP